jgi:hypothetical protein
MRAAAYFLIVIAGAWIAVWVIERVLIRAGIFQAMGPFGTPAERSASDARGKAHQQRVLRVAQRGLVPAAVLVLAGIVLFAMA